jgi:hypothetical protein
MASRGNPARFFVNAIPAMRRFDRVTVVTKASSRRITDIELPFCLTRFLTQTAAY